MRKRERRGKSLFYSHWKYSVAVFPGILPFPPCHLSATLTNDSAGPQKSLPFPLSPPFINTSSVQAGVLCDSQHPTLRSLVDLKLMDFCSERGSHIVKEATVIFFNNFGPWFEPLISTFSDQVGSEQSITNRIGSNGMRKSLTDNTHILVHNKFFKSLSLHSHMYICPIPLSLESYLPSTLSNPHLPCLALSYLTLPRVFLSTLYSRRPLPQCSLSLSVSLSHSRSFSLSLSVYLATAKKGWIPDNCTKSPDRSRKMVSFELLSNRQKSMHLE